MTVGNRGNVAVVRWVCLTLLATLLSASRVAAQGEPVLSGCEPDYPPYCIVTQDQQADGFSVELLRAALKAVGREVTFKVGPWSELKQDLADGRLQALPLMGRTPEREEVYAFTFPYLTMHGTLVVRGDNADIRRPADLKGKRVAVLQGDNAEEYLRRTDLGAVIAPLPSFEIALRELSAGKHDAVVVQKLVAFQLMQKAALSNLVTVGPQLYSQSFCLATRKGDSELLAALNEGLSIVMADGTFRQLHSKWFSAIEAAGQTRSRIVVGGDGDYPPYEFLDRNGQPAGYIVDLTRSIARQMGLSVDVQLEAWAKIRAGLEVGNIDVVQGMFYSVERDKDFAFSPPYAIVQHAIVVRKGSSELSGMNELAGKTILVMAGDIMEDLALKQGYEKQLVAVPTQEEALRLLAGGKYDCALVAKVPALYWIKKNGWHNLRVSSQSVLSAEYCYAVPHGRENLLSLFSDGLAALKATDEYRDIQTKWLSPYEALESRFQRVARVALVSILPLIVLLIGFFLWSRSLQRQVATRTREISFKNALLEAQSEVGIDAILVVDENGRILSYNRRFIEIWRLPSELVAKRLDEPVLKCVASQLANPQQFFERVQYLYEHKTETAREEIILGDGRVFDRYSAPIFGHADRYYGRVWYFRDITEHKEAQAEIRKLNEELELRVRDRTAQYEVSNRELESFAYSVSHDLRGPLRAIDGFSQSLLEDAKGKLDKGMTEDLVRIRKAAQRMARLIDSLLTLSRTTRQEMTIEPVDLSLLAEEIAADLRNIDPTRSAEFAITPGLVVNGDKQLIHVAIQNLLSNAWKFTQNSKVTRIEFGMRIADCGMEEKDSEIRNSKSAIFFVRDNGAGFDMAYADKLFGAFQRLHTDAEFEGTGIGLATVQRIIHRHGGKVWAESEVGKGATFYFTI